MADFNENKRKQEKTKGDGVNEETICCRNLSEEYLNVWVVDSR